MLVATSGPVARCVEVIGQHPVVVVAQANFQVGEVMSQCRAEAGVPFVEFEGGVALVFCGAQIDGESRRAHDCPMSVKVTLIRA